MITRDGSRHIRVAKVIERDGPSSEQMTALRRASLLSCCSVARAFSRGRRDPAARPQPLAPAAHRRGVAGEGQGAPLRAEPGAAHGATRSFLLASAARRRRACSRAGHTRAARAVAQQETPRVRHAREDGACSRRMGCRPTAALMRRDGLAAARAGSARRVGTGGGPTTTDGARSTVRARRSARASSGGVSRVCAGAGVQAEVTQYRHQLGRSRSKFGRIRAQQAELEQTSVESPPNFVRFGWPK